MKNLTLLSAAVVATTSGVLFGTVQTASALNWNWSYSGTGITAQGTFITNDTPDNLGFYLITGITGTRNGETIIGLQPTGTSIPGNEPFHVDNLISLNAQQLTKDSFGFQTSGGNYVNPFFASFLPTPGYLEVFSAPPFVTGAANFGPEDSELPINFSASIVPEPLTLLGAGTAMGFGSFFKRKLAKTKNNKV
ncbi:MAG: PEP-CTERM sorting domain-containing protein [Synechocystis sp.]